MENIIPIFPVLEELRDKYTGKSRIQRQDISHDGRYTVYV